MRKEYVLISLIFLFSLLLRIVPSFILGNPTNIDIYQHSQTSVNFAADGQIVQHVLYNYPLGYHTLVASFIVMAGLDALSIQIFLSSFFGALTVFPIFFLLKRIAKNSLIALSGALFFGFAPGAIIFSAGTGMPQTMAIFLGFSAFYLILRQLPERSPVFFATVLKDGFLWSMLFVVAGMTLAHTASTIFFSFMFVVLAFLVIHQNARNKLWTPVLMAVFFIFFMYVDFIIILLGFVVVFFIFLSGKAEKKYFFIVFACLGIILAFATYFPMENYYKERYYAIKYQASMPINGIFDRLHKIMFPIQPAETTSTTLGMTSTTIAAETTSTTLGGMTTIPESVMLTSGQLQNPDVFAFPALINFAYYPFIIGIAGLIMLFFGIYYGFRTKNLFVIAIFFWVIAVFVAIWSKRVEVREVSFLTIPIPLVAAFGVTYIEKIRTDLWKKVAIAILAVLILIPALAASAYAATNGPDREYAEAIYWLKNNCPDANLSVVFAQNSDFISFVLHQPVIIAYDIFIEPDLDKKLEMINTNNITHLVVSGKDKMRFARAFMPPLQRYMSIVGIYTPERSVVVPGIELIENRPDVFKKVYDKGNVAIYAVNNSS